MCQQQNIYFCVYVVLLWWNEHIFTQLFLTGRSNQAGEGTRGRQPPRGWWRGACKVHARARRRRSAGVHLAGGGGNCRGRHMGSVPNVSEGHPAGTRSIVRSHVARPACAPTSTADTAWRYGRQAGTKRNGGTRRGVKVGAHLPLPLGLPTPLHVVSRATVPANHMLWGG